MAEPKPITIQLTQKEIDRFWSYVDKSKGQGPNGNCWEWQASRRRGGVGRITFRHSKSFNAPRVAYFLANVIDPYPFLVCYRCDNPPCCNPIHLFKGTNADNSEDMVNKGRAAYGLRNGKHTHPEKRQYGDNHHAHKTPEVMARGETNGNSKLNEDSVREIRELYATGEWSSRMLGRKFHLDKSTVLDIVSGRIWKHLPIIAPLNNSQTSLPTGSHHKRAFIE